MRLGLIARCRERGLGVLSHEVARHMAPAKVLVVARDDVDFVDESRFPGARWVKQPQRHNAVAAIADGLSNEDLDWLLTDVDVCLTFETPYDFRLFDLARQRGVGTALMGMFEYLPYRVCPELPRPDVFLAPSPWCLPQWPQPVRLLPVPVATDRLPARHVRRVETIVHAAGAYAKGDRNGTEALVQALPFLRNEVRIVLRSQGSLARWRVRTKARVEVAPPAPAYWQVHDGADALVLPRRYGGLSLPIQEASALGLPVIGLSREQGAGYGHAGVVRCRERPLRLPCGPVDRADCAPRDLAAAIDHLVEESDTAQAMSDASAAWARAHSWEALRPSWEAALASVAP